MQILVIKTMGIFFELLVFLQFLMKLLPLILKFSRIEILGLLFGFVLVIVDFL